MESDVPERNLLEQSAVGGSRVSRKGKARPSEAGRGKYSPPANPDRVTAEAMKRRNEGFHFRNNISGESPDKC